MTFTNKISRHLSKPEKKFTADITYGILASQSCLLTDIVDCLHEPSLKINTVDRLSRHLDKGSPASAAASYLKQVKKCVQKKGYHVTEACVLTRSNHPVSIFSRIHSSSEKDYKSVNTITFQAMEQEVALFGRAVFCMDRGYDDNKMFLKLDALGQDYVIWVARIYFSRWKIEEYFRRKKQMFRFENFRVRKLKSGQYPEFLYHLVHGILRPSFHGIRDECTQGFHYKNSRSNKTKSFLLLLPAGKRYLQHTVICKRRRQALVSDETSEIPSTLP